MQIRSNKLKNDAKVLLHARDGSRRSQLLLMIFPSSSSSIPTPRSLWNWIAILLVISTIRIHKHIQIRFHR